MSVTKEKVLSDAIHAAASIMIGDTETDPSKRKVSFCQHVVDFYEWMRLLLVNSAWPIPVIDSTWYSQAIAAGILPPTPPTPVTPPVPSGPPTPPMPLSSISPVDPSSQPQPPPLSREWQEYHGLSREMQGSSEFQRLLKITPSNRSGK